MFENLGHLFNIIQHGPALKRKMYELHDQFEVARHSGFSSDRGIEVVVNGTQRLICFKIAPEWLPGKSTEDLERELLVAYMDAVTTSRTIMEDEIKKATNGVSVPMLDGLLGLGGKA